MSCLESFQKITKQIAEECIPESEVILIQKNKTHMYKDKLNYIHQNFQWWRKDQGNNFLIFGLYPLI